MRRFILFAALLLLAACAPVATEPGRVEIEQLNEALSFYPQETGAVWRYLPDGERLDATPLFQRIEGPTVINGERWIAWRLVGRGLDNYSFRQYRDDGVYLLREIRPGTEITFDPPLKELPAQRDLRVGISWAGETTAQLFFPEARPESQRSELELSYSYTVVDKRNVSVVAGDFEVFVINFESRSMDAEGNIIETIRQEQWFAPFAGEIRTKLAYFLVETNFLPSTGE